MDERKQRILNAASSAQLRSASERLGRYCHGVPFFMVYLRNRNGEVTVGEVAEEFTVSMPRVSSMVKQLVAHGFVKKSKKRGDHRSTYISLTEEGKAKADEIIAKEEESIDIIISKVGIEKMELFLDYAKEISAAIDAIKEEGDEGCYD